MCVIITDSNQVMLCDSIDDIADHVGKNDIVTQIFLDDDGAVNSTSENITLDDDLDLIRSMNTIYSPVFDQIANQTHPHFRSLPDVTTTHVSQELNVSISSVDVLTSKYLVNVSSTQGSAENNFFDASSPIAYLSRIRETVSYIVSYQLYSIID